MSDDTLKNFFDAVFALPEVEEPAAEEDDGKNDPEAVAMAKHALRDIALLYAWSSGGRLSDALLPALLAMKQVVEIAAEVDAEASEAAQGSAPEKDEGDDVSPETQAEAENVESPHQDEAEQEKPASAPCFDPPGVA